MEDSPLADRLVLTASAAGALPDSREQNPETVAVHLRDVHESVGSVEAARGVDLTIRSEEVLAFLGPNGAGKTSTIRASARPAAVALRLKQSP